MFRKCGSKCKIIAKIAFWLISSGTILGIIIWISVLGWCDGYPALLLLIPIGVLIAWLSSILLYTIGDIWERQYYYTMKILEKTGDIDNED